MPNFKVKRVYEPSAEADGLRVLVDRVWPRGVSKNAAALDGWAKDLAPSTELRQWFAHDPEKFDAFTERYRDELDASCEVVTQHLAQWAKQDTVTLVYSAKDEQHNQAVVLCAYLTARSTKA